MEQSKRNAWLGVIAAAVLAFAGYRVFFKSDKAFSYPDEFTATGVCLHCGQTVTFSFAAGAKPPYHCEGCGEDAVYPWWYCEDCHYRFVPEMIREPGQPPRPNPYPTCTHCGCPNVSGWDSENPYQVPDGDAKLPPWP